MRHVYVPLSLALLTFLAACSSSPTGTLPPAGTATVDFSDIDIEYVVGPADQLEIFVWQNPDLSRQVTVQPDGQIALPLIGVVQAAGKTPEVLADELEVAFARFINDPNVSITPTGFAGLSTSQIRVLGEATQPANIPYRTNMTLLDVVISVGGLTQFADGNRAVIVREVDGEQQTYRVFLDSLVRNGDIQRNVDMLPGDVLIIPQRYF